MCMPLEKKSHLGKTKVTLKINYFAKVRLKKNKDLSSLLNNVESTAKY